MSSATSSSKDGAAAPSESAKSSDAAASAPGITSSPLEFKFRNLAGDLHSVPITIGTSAIAANAENLASYIKEENNKTQIMKDMKANCKKLQVFRTLSETEKQIKEKVEIEIQQLESNSAYSFCTVEDLSDDEKADIAKRYGIAVGEVGEWGLELENEGGYRLRSIGINGEEKNGTDSETTAGASAPERETNQENPASGNARGSQSNSSSSGSDDSASSNTVKVNDNETRNDNSNTQSNATILTSATIDDDGLLHMPDDDSLVLPAGVELPAFAALGDNIRERGLLEGEPADLSEDDVEEGPAQKRRKIMPDEESDQGEVAASLSTDNRNSTDSIGATSETNAEANNTGKEGNKAENRDNKAGGNTMKAVNDDSSMTNTSDPRKEATAAPRIYFMNVCHLQELVTRHLDCPYKDLMGIVEERESSEPLCLTPSPFLEHVDDVQGFREKCCTCAAVLWGPEAANNHARRTGHTNFQEYRPSESDSSTKTVRWIPLYLARNGSNLPSLVSSSSSSSTGGSASSSTSVTTVPSNEPAQCCPAAEFRVVVMEYRWKHQESSPHVLDLLELGPNFFRKYCHSKVYFDYPHSHSESPSSASASNSENDKYSRVLQFLINLGSCDYYPGWSNRNSDTGNQEHVPGRQGPWWMCCPSLDLEDVLGILRCARNHAGGFSTIRFIHHLEPSVRDSKPVALAAVKINGYVIADFSAQIRADREVMLAALDCGSDFIPYILSRASPELQDDREVVECAVRRDCMALRHASARLRIDESLVEIVEMEVPKSRVSGPFLPEEIQQKSFCGTCMKFNCDQPPPRTHVRQPLLQYLKSDAYLQRFRKDRK